jgi:hypothetical protein
MTKLVFVWTSNSGLEIEMTSYTAALERVKNFGGRFVSKCIEGKDVDYVTPNPRLKSYKKRAVIA